MLLRFDGFEYQYFDSCRFDDSTGVVACPGSRISAIWIKASLQGLGVLLNAGAGVMLYVRLYAISGTKTMAANILTINGLDPRAHIHDLTLSLSSPKGHPQLIAIVPEVAMCLSVYFGIKVYWASRKTNRLIKVFYEDGTYYFISLAVMALINVVGALCLPTRFQSLVGPPQAVLHSILATRMALRLRDQAKGDVSINMSADSGIGSGLRWAAAPSQGQFFSSFDFTFKGDP
ncbi:hypothetical protein BKA70DRAFT_1493969 [Coprinopsis sp. MPI-PUGE-AT-0042]|nr:hypothetical protein BKA70DRAFT_1493969 [Coprinopsis sp. MPI-PUGE-AT-0042]